MTQQPTEASQRARCNACGRQVPAQTVRSPLGKVVTVIFCPSCDVVKR